MPLLRKDVILRNRQQVAASGSWSEKLMRQFTVSPSLGFSSFLYSDLMRITGNFDDRSTSAGGSRIGEGGFGTVYKGLLNDKPVAVKKLNPVSENIFNRTTCLCVLLLIASEILYYLGGWHATGQVARSVQPRDPDSESVSFPQEEGEEAYLTYMYLQMQVWFNNSICSTGWNTRIWLTWLDFPVTNSTYV